MAELARVRDALREHRIRDAADYAEVLVAEALNGKREASGVNKGYDVVAEPYGRIEVKCRVLPPDGRKEDRVSIGDSKENGFDYLALVIFFSDFRVKGAVLVPYAAVWELTRRQKYSRVNYATASSLQGAVDITESMVSLA